MNSGIGIGSATRLVGLTAGLLALGATLLLAPRADAYVYWADFDGLAGDSIGRAPLTNPNGPGKDASFIDVAAPPAGIAVNATHIYWGSLSSPDKAIARANLDGTDVIDRFDSASEPNGVALSSTHAYWTRGSVVERSPLGDPNGDEVFVADAGQACGVAVNATHVFWGNQTDEAIGRAPLSDPNGAEKDVTWIEGADNPCGVAVNGTHIYWANSGDSLDGTTIGRATLAATSIDHTFITGAAAPCGVAVNATHVFWANNAAGTIGRATLGGGGVNQGFVTGAGGPCGVAVDALGSPPAPGPAAKPSNEFSFGKAKRNKRNGTAKLEVLVPGGGHLALAGDKVKPVDQDVGAAARASGASLTATLKVKARGKARKKLKTRGKAKVAVDVTYTPSGGDPNTLGTGLKLKKKG